MFLVSVNVYGFCVLTITPCSAQPTKTFPPGMVAVAVTCVPALTVVVPVPFTTVRVNCVGVVSLLSKNALIMVGGCVAVTLRLIGTCQSICIWLPPCSCMILITVLPVCVEIRF
jgi:hypothetical protein